MKAVRRAHKAARYDVLNGPTMDRAKVPDPSRQREPAFVV
jgi:hypothetical protein